ncbi:MAG: NAD-dependent dehydratase, partial [Oligoflexia bacterium]|nr:NAD-dependent dehydratase [Oligoflexia bacterium]
IEKLVYKIASLLKKDITVETDNVRLRPEKSEVERLWGDNSKICRMTNWTPQYDLNSGLTETIEWFRSKKNLEKYKAQIYNR